MKKEWSKFSVGSPSTRNNWTNPSCIPFNSVGHVTHIDNSLSIFIDKKIKSGLVFDESVLNRQRILVSWLSPNQWANGYRYGNVRLRYKWKQIIKNRTFYWVESIAYEVPACRILITDKKHDNLPQYDPEEKNGPWWYDASSEQNYYNGKYCLEFMVEEDLMLTPDTRVDFVTHHDKWCSMHRYNPTDCSDLGLANWHAAGIFLSHVLARSINISSQLFKNNNEQNTPEILKYCCSALCFNIFELDNMSFDGKTMHRDNVAIPLSRAICNAFANSDTKEVKILGSTFKTKRHFTKSLAKLVAMHFDLDSWEDILEKR